ncbi:MAG: hypothetical protein AB7U63_09430 [Porticoccaceae bacterium]
MILKEHADFQFNEDSPLDWCETNFFPFAVPEHRISGSIYVLTRPKLGVTMSDVLVQDRINPLWEAQAYVDNQQHLPCPSSLLDYRLANGVSVTAVTPLEHYHLEYEGIDDTFLELDFHSLMPPFDMNDPDMDPTAADRIGAGWGGAAFSGHYEITGRITGLLRVRGREYKLDCIDTLDRSWGPRKERNNGNATWIHGSFGERLTIHAFVGLDPANEQGFGSLISGYVLENGEISGLVAAEGEVERQGLLPMSSRLRVTDQKGRSFDLTAAAINGCIWAPYPSLVYAQSFMRWNCRGEIGYGIQQDVISRAYLTRHRDAIAAI